MIPFSPPRIDQNIIDEVVDTLRSGWITTGPKTKLFEREITAYSQTKKTICLNSGTAGIELALAWYGIGPGDEVIIPAYTYTATANAVMHSGATPVMCDAGDDFNIDVSKIEELITERTKVIVPVDIGGLPCDYDEINAITRKKSILKKFNAGNSLQKQLGRIMVLADAAHSIGSEYKGKKAAAHTDAAIFSFHAVKNLTTAEGGALTLNLPGRFDHDEIYAQLSAKSLHGQTKDALAKVQKGGWRYDVIEPGYKYNMTDVLASIGLVELRRYENDTLKRRREIYNMYNQLLSEYDWALLPELENDLKKGNAHLYLLRIKDIEEAHRNDMITEIYEQDVAVNVHYQPLPILSYYKHSGYNIDTFPNAFELYKNEISLPIYYDLTNDQVHTIVNAVVHAYNQVVNKKHAEATV